MANLLKSSNDASLSADNPLVAIEEEQEVMSAAIQDGEINSIIPILEETLTVSKRRRVTGGVRVSTHTELVETSAEVEIERYRVEVTRVPVGRVVAEAPAARAEGDTTIVPVIEERFVVVKQLFLVEELRIRHVLKREMVSEPVTLRRQRAVVERIDAESGLIDGDEASPLQRAAK